MMGGVHLEWGTVGLRETARLADTAVIVDVLSFSTTVSVAVDRGARVYPLRQADPYGPKVAARLGAHLAGDRGSRFSLSPPTAAGLAPGERLVLSSPNGAALCLLAARQGLRVVAGCLRNAGAVAAWVRQHGGRVVVIAAGERWRDGSMRVGVEDLLGAGAILDGLPAATLTPEALVAAAAFRAARPHLAVSLAECTSGQELRARGWAEDVKWAAALDASASVPVLADGAFGAAVA
jgi:2-phosphosulfolactate phosphatase